MRVFLDTNIIVDVLLNRPGFVADSEAVILRCETGGHPMFIAWHGLATAYYLLKRGRTEIEAMVEIDKLLSLRRRCLGRQRPRRSCDGLRRFRRCAAGCLRRSIRGRPHRNAKRYRFLQKQNPRDQPAGIPPAGFRCLTSPIRAIREIRGKIQWQLPLPPCGGAGKTEGSGARSRSSIG